MSASSLSLRLGPAARPDARMLTTVTAALAVVGCWLLTHPYLGLAHDGVLYGGQALNRLSGGALRDDLFFAFGSQDDFTLFTPLYAALVDRLGFVTGPMVLIALSHALWLSGAAHLLLRLTGARAPVTVALLAVALGAPFYGGYGVLVYGEGFATPRPLAEALVLHGLGFLFAGRLGLAMAAHALAASMHPLMAVPGMGVALVALGARDRRWLWLAVAGALAALGLALAGVAPFDRLLRAMDPEFYAIVSQRDGYGFPSEWWLRDWSRLALQAAALVAGAVTLGGRLRLFLLAVLGVGLGGLATQLVGGDLMANTLVIQLQPWRCQWLLAFAANAAIGLMLLRLWRESANALPVTALLVLYGMWSIDAASALAFAAPAFALLAADLRGRLPPLSPLLTILAVALAAASVDVIGAVRLFKLGDQLAIHLGGTEALVHTAVDPIAVLVILGGPFLLRRKAPGPATALVGALLAGLVGTAAWDRRPHQQVALESMIGAESPFARHLPADAQVFWRRGLVETWFLLQRPSYITAQQGAGVLFSPATAAAFSARAAVVKPLDGRDMIDPWFEYRRDREDNLAFGGTTPAALATVCRGARGALYAVVLDRKFDGLATASWAVPISRRRAKDGEPQPPPDAYYLYLCEHVLAAEGAGPAAR